MQELTDFQAAVDKVEALPPIKDWESPTLAAELQVRQDVASRAIAALHRLVAATGDATMTDTPRIKGTPEFDFRLELPLDHRGNLPIELVFEVKEPGRLTYAAARGQTFYVRQEDSLLCVPGKTYVAHFSKEGIVTVREDVTQ